MRKITAFGVAIAATLWSSAALAQGQTGSQQQTPAQMAASGAQELYHVHFVKAAPGKVAELADAYLKAPREANEPEPIVLRHVQGDDWDLAVITPLGKDETLTAQPMTAQEQQSSMQMRGLRAQHSDTFTIGPAWSEAQAALLGTSAARTAGAQPMPGQPPTGQPPTGQPPTGQPPAGQPPAGQAVGTAGRPNGDQSFYTVTVYRALPGHRDQLAQVLDKLAKLGPGTAVTLQHIEGSPWEFVMVSRYDSWAQIGEDPPAEQMKSMGWQTPDAIGSELRQHVAEHRDTIARRVR